MFAPHDYAAMRQRAQHLAVALSARHRVVYVNPCYYSAIGYARDWIGGRLRRGGVWQVETITPTLQVASFPPLLPKGSRFPAIARLDYAVQLPFIRATLNRLGIARPILWLTTPTDHLLIGRLGERLTVYDCMDDHAGFHDAATGARVRQQEDNLIGAADAVFASSTLLAARCEAVNPNTHIVRNGVEADNFMALSADPAAARALDGLPRPILGYMGFVGAWFDVDAVRRLAEAYPHATIVLLGPIRADLGGLESLPNVCLVGERPYTEMGAFVRRFDVCLIPFQVNDLTRAVNPVKLYEYFALGKPVAATALPELERYEAHAYLVRSPDEWVTQTARAIEEGTDVGRIAARTQIARENGWAARAAPIEAVLDALVSRR